MTKRRPSWSEIGRRLAALALSLGLAGAVQAAAPASGQTVLGEGLASYYGGKFNGRRTASGEVFDKTEFTAASNRFPLGSMLAVRRPANGLCAIVRVNDRMHRRLKLRIIDVSKSAASSLDLVQIGVSRVQVVPLGDNWAQQGTEVCARAFAAVGQTCLTCAGVPETVPPESGPEAASAFDVPAYNQHEIPMPTSEKGIAPP